MFSANHLSRVTDKDWGSKFLSPWGVQQVTDWIEQQVIAQGWQKEPGVRRRIDLRMPAPVGVLGGKLVHTIRLVSDGTIVHAYPVKDEK